MKKLSIVADITFTGLFIYFYRSSGKFRNSIMAAFVAASFYFSSLNDAFTPQNQQHRSRPQKGKIAYTKTISYLTTNFKTK